jgi:nucleolar protein 16
MYSSRLSSKLSPTQLQIRDSSKTLTQNYRRLGLTSRLNSLTGGTEVAASKTSTSSKLAISHAVPTTLAPTTARVERDPETGKIIKVIHGKPRKANPLNDPLNSDDDGGDEEMQDAEEEAPEGNKIIKELEALASMVPGKKVRKQSEREKEWIARLVERYGSDYKAMARDRKLNPMQQTEADIARRVRKWKDGNGGGVVEVEG